MTPAHQQPRRATAYSVSVDHVTIGAAKNKRPGPPTAPTVGMWPGSRRPSDSEERKRLVDSIPPTPDTASTCTEPHVDGCGSCIYNSEEPLLWVPDDQGGCSCVYRCSDCGYEWTTNYGGCA